MKNKKLSKKPVHPFMEVLLWLLFIVFIVVIEIGVTFVVALPFTLVNNEFNTWLDIYAGILCVQAGLIVIYLVYLVDWEGKL